MSDTKLDLLKGTLDLSAQFTNAHPRDRNDFQAKLSLLSEHVSGRIRPALFVLACAVGVVMLIVCANLSHLLLARTAVRQKEIAIRTALGAGRGRLIRQILTESVVLSCCGAIVALILAVGGRRVWLTWMPSQSRCSMTSGQMPPRLASPCSGPCSRT